VTTLGFIFISCCVSVGNVRSVASLKGNNTWWGVYLLQQSYIKVVKSSRNRPGVPQRVPGALGSQIFMTFGTRRWWGRQPHAPAAFTPRNLICLLHNIWIHDFHSEFYLQTMQCFTVCQYQQVRKWSRAYEVRPQRCSVPLTGKSDRYTFLCCTLQQSR
jgi:hypothetical protein